MSGTRFSEGLVNLLLWGPRVLGLLIAIYAGMFALDAFTHDKPIGEALGDFLLHAAPSFLVLFIVIISWRRQWIAGVFFIAIAVYYAVTTLERTDWILVVSLPLFVTGLFYLLSWWKRDQISS